MTRGTRQSLRQAAGIALRNWPNAHPGHIAQHADLRAMFQRLRRRVDRGEALQSAICAIEPDAYRAALAVTR
ncbi:MAG: hypothetical protein V4720_06375 [Pseudomonadota bacterium]